jgi:hypothetical protein
MTRSNILNNILLSSENAEIFDELKKNDINLDELILKEELTIPSWTSTYDINTKLSSLLKMQTSPEIYQRYFLSIL